MVQKEKLVQFYFNQYRDWAKAFKKKNNDGRKTYEQRIDRLLDQSVEECRAWMGELLDKMQLNDKAFFCCQDMEAGSDDLYV